MCSRHSSEKEDPPGTRGVPVVEPVLSDQGDTRCGSFRTVNTQFPVRTEGGGK